MPTEPGREITRLIGEVVAGKPGAKDALVEHVYPQLHDIACRMMARERQGHSWGATDLVNEAYLRALKDGTPGRLADRPPAEWRHYFFGAAARAMRQLLIAHAKDCKSKRPPDKRVPLLDDLVQAVEQSQRVNLEELDTRLKELETFAPREHEIVMLRVFGGLKVAEVAARLNLSVSTVERDWKWARTWLYTRLRS